MGSLIECPACGRQVSDQAEVCPGCGHPLAAERDLVAGRRVQTIERTAKRYKGLILAGGIASCVGLFLSLASCQEEPMPWWGTMGQWVLMGGLPLYVGARLAAWWHHG